MELRLAARHAGAGSGPRPGPRGSGAPLVEWWHPASEPRTGLRDPQLLVLSGDAPAWGGSASRKRPDPATGCITPAACSSFPARVTVGRWRAFCLVPGGEPVHRADIAAFAGGRAT